MGAFILSLDSMREEGARPTTGTFIFCLDSMRREGPNPPREQPFSRRIQWKEGPPTLHGSIDSLIGLNELGAFTLSLASTTKEPPSHHGAFIL